MPSVDSSRAAVAAVAIASDPVGAHIEIENIDSGRTPAIVKLQPGEYRITLTLRVTKRGRRSLLFRRAPRARSPPP